MGLAPRPGPPFEPGYNGRVEGSPLVPPKTLQEMKTAMAVSLAFGALMLAGKLAAYWLTGSAAILSDAVESVIHVAAVSFATASLWLSARPADRRFSFGYERINFFSAGFEGALIILAAAGIIYSAVRIWLAGLPLERLGQGALITLAAALVNGALGFYLIRVGKRHRSLIVEANGRHVLTDSWTSFGIVGGLALVLLTGWRFLDPLFAIAVALNILWSGGKLVWRSVTGLMDYSDPAVGRQIRQRLDEICGELGLHYHGLRFRNAGYRHMIEVHLLFPSQTELGEAHRLATLIERRLPEKLELPAEVVTHLEALEDHGEVHGRPHHADLHRH